MKISVITLGMMQPHQGQFYNAQDIGLGRALAAIGNDVDVFNFVPLGSGEDTEDLGDNLRFHQIPTKATGIHSMYKKDFIPQGTEGVVCFSDNQMNFERILNYCKKNGIKCIPYVGVLESNNDNKLKGMLMNMLSDNMKHYKMMTVLAKTPEVMKEMKEQGVNSVILAPVCLDETLLNKDYKSSDVQELKTTLGRLHGRDLSGHVVLFVGRLQEEKHPVEMVDVFADIKKMIHSSQMIMIGKGHLEGSVKAEIGRKGLFDSVTLVERVENSQMWKYYSIADVVVNLNDHEIFGMSILEAMYYGKHVVAVSAPGPDYIIQNKAQGTLCESEEDVAQAVYKPGKEFDSEAAHERVENNFLWNVTARTIMQQLT